MSELVRDKSVLQRESARRVTTLKRPWNSQKPLAISEDGKVVVALTYDFAKRNNAIVVWDISSGRSRTFPCNESAANSLFLLPDKRTLLIGTGGQFAGGVSVWDIYTGRKLRTVAQGKVTDRGIVGIETVFAVAASPDGKSIAVGSTRDGEGNTPASGKIVFLNTSTGKISGSIPNWKDTVRAVAWSPDHRLLVAADAGLSVISMRSGRVVRRYTLSDEPVVAVAFSKDGQQIFAVDAAHRFFVVDRQTHRVRQTFQGPRLMGHDGTPPTTYAAIASNGHFVSTAFLAKPNAEEIAVWRGL